MAKTVPTADVFDGGYPRMQNELRVEISARLVHDDGQKVILEIDLLEVVPLEKLMLERHLQDLGLNEDDANYLGEQFYRLAETHLLSKAIAKRMRRV